MAANVLRNFAQSFYELVGSTTNDDVMSLYNGYLACPTAGSIDTFIRASEPFAKKNTMLILKVHGLVSTSGRELGEAAIEKLKRRFVTDASFDVDKLREEIETIVRDEAIPPAAPASASPVPEEVRGPQEVCGTHGAQEVRQHGQHEQHEQHTMQQHEQGVQGIYEKFDASFVDAFEAEFQRPMFVQEYFFYTPDVLASLPVLHSKFTDNYIAARQAYLNFMDTGLSMHDFVKWHLHEFQGCEFVDALVASMIASVTYETSMRKKLDAMYLSMYDEVLAEEDFGYILKRLRAKNMPLAHEGLSMEIGDYRAETMLLAENVDACFRKVLRRAAEPAESSANILIFRRCAHDSNANANELTLRRKLIATLEFHDVVKEIIRDALIRAEGGPREASVSQRYTILREVLGRIVDTDDFNDVVAHITNVVNAPK